MKKKQNEYHKSFCRFKREYLPLQRYVFAFLSQRMLNKVRRSSVSSKTSDRMIFEAAWKSLSDPYKKLIVNLFSKWMLAFGGEGAIIISNIQNERFLPPDIMSQLLKTLAIESSKFSSIQTSVENIEKNKTNRSKLREDIKRLERKVEKVIYSKWQMRGGEITCDWPVRFGNVQPVSRVKNHLRVHLPQIDEKALDKLLNKLSSYSKNDRIGEIHIRPSQLLIWVTWNSENPLVKEPFPFWNRMSISTETLRNQLGLCDSVYNGNLLVMDFDATTLRSENLRVFRPTFCEAPFYAAFAPPSTEIRFGRTNPCTIKMPFSLRTSSKWEGQPEGVGKGHHFQIKNIVQSIFLYSTN